MSTADLVEHLKQMSDTERLEVIEAATRLIRDNLIAGTENPLTEQERRIQAAAANVKGLYEHRGEFTEWTALDAEEFADGYIQG